MGEFMHSASYIFILSSPGLNVCSFYPHSQTESGAGKSRAQRGLGGKINT